MRVFYLRASLVAVIIAVLAQGQVALGQDCKVFEDRFGGGVPITSDPWITFAPDISPMNVTCREADDGFNQCNYIQDCITATCIGQSTCNSAKFYGAKNIACDSTSSTPIKSTSSCASATFSNMIEGGSVTCSNSFACGRAKMGVDADIDGDGTDDVDESGSFDVNCNGRGSCEEAEINARAGTVVCGEGNIVCRNAKITAKCLACSKSNGCGSGCEFTSSGTTTPVDCPTTNGVLGDCTADVTCAAGGTDATNCQLNDAIKDQCDTTNLQAGVGEIKGAVVGPTSTLGQVKSAVDDIEMNCDTTSLQTDLTALKGAILPGNINKIQVLEMELAAVKNEIGADNILSSKTVQERLIALEDEVTTIKANQALVLDSNIRIEANQAEILALLKDDDDEESDSDSKLRKAKDSDSDSESDSKLRKAM